MTLSEFAEALDKIKIERNGILAQRNKINKKRESLLIYLNLSGSNLDKACPLMILFQAVVPSF